MNPLCLVPAQILGVKVALKEKGKTPSSVTLMQYPIYRWVMFNALSLHPYTQMHHLLIISSDSFVDYFICVRCWSYSNLPRPLSLHHFICPVNLSLSFPLSLFLSASCPREKALTLHLLSPCSLYLELFNFDLSWPSSIQMLSGTVSELLLVKSSPSELTAASKVHQEPKLLPGHTHKRINTFSLSLSLSLCWWESRYQWKVHLQLGIWTAREEEQVQGEKDKCQLKHPRGKERETGRMKEEKKSGFRWEAKMLMQVMQMLRMLWMLVMQILLLDAAEKLISNATLVTVNALTE